MIEIRESEIHYPKEIFALADHKSLLWAICLLNPGLGELSHSLPQLGDPLIMSLLLLGVSIPLSLGCIRTQTCILSGRSLIFACRLGCPQCWAMYSPKCKSLSLKVFNVWYISLFIFWEKKRKTQQATVLSKISLFSISGQNTYQTCFTQSCQF